MDELYSKDILRLTMMIPNEGRMADPDITVEKHSRICGSKLILDAKCAAGRITDFAIKVEACALGQSACGLLGPRLTELTVDDLVTARSLLSDILSAKRDAPLSDDPLLGQWAGFAVYHTARDHKSRHPSILLIFDAAIEVLK